MSMSGARPAKALGLTLVLFLLLGSGLGFAQAAENAPAGHVPLPGPGDRAVYHAVEVRPPSYVRPFEGPLQITYEWQDQVVIMDDQADRRVANPLMQEFRHQGVAFYTVWTYYDAVTGEPLGYHVGREWDYSNSCITMCPSGLTNIHVDGELAWMSYAEQRGPCGLMGPVHGTDASARSMVLAGHCTYTDGPQEVVFTRQADTFHSTVDPDVAIQYEAGTPFPAEMTVPMSELWSKHWGAGRLWHMERIDQDVTGMAYAVPAQALIEPGPPLPRLAPRTPWMLDDAGVDHPFLLRDAYAYALADDQGTRVSSWLDAHPAAYLAEAWAVAKVDRNDNEHNIWYLVWSDGSEVISKRVISRPVTVLGVGLDVGEREVVVEDWQREDHAEGDIEYPAIATLPTHLPRVADTMALYRFAEDPERLPEQPNRYGFGWYCEHGDCDRPYALVSSGFYDGPPDDSGDPTAGALDYTKAFIFAPETRYSQVMVDDQGRLRYTERAEYRESGRPLGMDPAQLAPQAADEPPSSGSRAWIPPTASAATGAGFLAVIIGALYYFWPVIKTLPGVSLFSRIAHDKVLDHPRRQQVHDIIAAQPGVHFQQLARTTGLGRGALDHHLAKLSDAGLIVPKIGQGYTCYFAKGIDRHVMAAAGAVKSPGAKRLLQALRSSDVVSMREAAAEAGVAVSTASHHMARLREAGLVEKTPKGYRATELAARTII